MITAGDGKYRVWMKRVDAGEDLVYVVGGGERPHIGSVVVKVPGRDTQVIVLEGHYDNVVLEPIADAASKKYNKTVVALGGVHVDDATKEEIDLLVENCKELERCI